MPPAVPLTSTALRGRTILDSRGSPTTAARPGGCVAKYNRLTEIELDNPDLPDGLE